MTLRRPALAAGVFVAVSLAPIAARAQAPVAEADYISRLDEAVQITEQSCADPASCNAILSSARVAIGLPLQVQRPGTATTIPADPFLEGSAAATSALVIRAHSHLVAELEAARADAGAVPPDPARIRAALDRAYAGLHIDSGWLGRIFRDIRDAIIGGLSRFFDSLSRFHGFGSLAAWLTVAGLAVLAIIVAKRLAAGLVTEKRTRVQKAAAKEAVDWRKRAEEALARADLEEAVHCLYRLLLALLAVRGVLKEIPSLTSGETRKAVAKARPELYESVDGATRVFERVAYGGRPAGTEEVGAMRRAERELEKA